VPVDRYGLVDSTSVEEAITEETILVSIMHANNEVGTIEPIGEVAEIAKRHGLPFHTDAVQTLGTIPIDVQGLGVDLLSLAGQGFYGPKGVGALYIRGGTRIIPFIDGGIQEGGRRAGTENVAGIVGLGVAAELAQREMADRANHLIPLRDGLIEGLLEIDGVHLTGHPKERLPGHVSVVVEYVEGEAMLLSLNLKGVAASSGSACTSRALKASHVLEAMGIDPGLAQGSLLLTLGMGNTMEDAHYFLEVLPRSRCHSRYLRTSLPHAHHKDGPEDEGTQSRRGVGGLGHRSGYPRGYARLVSSHRERIPTARGKRRRISSLRTQVATVALTTILIHGIFVSALREASLSRACNDERRCLGERQNVPIS